MSGVAGVPGGRGHYSRFDSKGGKDGKDGKAGKGGKGGKGGQEDDLVPGEDPNGARPTTRRADAARRVCRCARRRATASGRWRQTVTRQLARLGRQLTEIQQAGAGTARPGVEATATPPKVGSHGLTAYSC